jgi:hypothetical protein
MDCRQSLIARRYSALPVVFQPCQKIPDQIRREDLYTQFFGGYHFFVFAEKK